MAKSLHSLGILAAMLSIAADPTGPIVNVTNSVPILSDIFAQFSPLKSKFLAAAFGICGAAVGIEYMRKRRIGLMSGVLLIINLYLLIFIAS